MALFTGVVTTSGLNEGAVLWSNTPTNPVAGTVGDSLGQGPTYYIFDTCTSFNWINCDYFYDAPNPKTDITVVMPDGTYNDTTTNVYVVFPTLNVVASMMHYDAATHAFSFSTPNYYCPVGLNIKVMIMGIKNNAYFYDLQTNLTVTNGMTLTANPGNTTLSALQAVLAGL
ncbi:MAG: hypothetical protein EOP51_30905 [Sphingobacteriales bacterium]|nr:MAG: hypothetical protein EOP51_30905 [Sphingobacteriales bacterium]